MLEWNEPQLTDREWISSCVKESGYIGSDAAFANIFLLQSKYNINVASYKGYLIRYYDGHLSRHGYTFPLGRGNIDKALEAIRQDAIDMDRKLEFCFITEEQKVVLDNYYGDILEYSRDDGDSDYIYGQQELSTLAGRAYHKKKNHVSKFNRTYDDIRYSDIGEANIEDAVMVEDIWYSEHQDDIDDSAQIEYAAIKNALQNYDKLGLMGGILYVNNVPAAMTIASYITDDAIDIHYEKCISEYAVSGGYAAINQRYAATLNNVTYINREEDINIPGLRKAKESYHPKIMLKKYHAVQGSP